jgi:hypothetical protein
MHHRYACVACSYGFFVYKAAVNYKHGYETKLTDDTGKTLKGTKFVSK